MVTVNTPEHQIVGYPVDIEANRYPRNHLIFNVALVFDTDAEASLYEPLLRKYVALSRSLLRARARALSLSLSLSLSLIHGSCDHVPIPKRTACSYDP